MKDIQVNIGRQIDIWGPFGVDAAYFLPSEKNIR